MSPVRRGKALPNRPDEGSSGHPSAGHALVGVPMTAYCGSKKQDERRSDTLSLQPIDQGTPEVFIDDHVIHEATANGLNDARGSFAPSAHNNDARRRVVGC